MWFKKKSKVSETKKSPFDAIIDCAKASGKKIVLPEAFDERVIEAAKKAASLDLCKVVLLGDEVMLKEKFTKNELKNIEIINPLTDGKKREMYANSYYELRKNKGMTPEKALEEMKENMKFACMMLYSDDADGIVAGAVYHSADVMRPALQIIKNKPGVSKVSSSFIMEMPNGSNLGENGFMIFSDCAVVIDPTDEELADIAILSADLAKNICGMKPRVALLSYSSKGAEDNPDETIQKVKRAYKLIRRKDSSLIVDGELQADAAIVPSVAEAKAKGSVVEGKANVLVFPNINAGNIGYKLVQRIAGVKAVGPILQGLKKPVNDLSRGTNADEIVLNIAITVLQAKNILKGE